MMKSSQEKQRIKISRKSDTEFCPCCGNMAVRVYLVRVGVLEFILCHRCLTDLQYECHPHTRWP